MNRLALVAGATILAAAFAACDTSKPISIDPATLPDATAGQPYAVTITTTKPTGMEIISIMARGNLPSGITLQYSRGLTAELVGTPTASGSYQFTVTAYASGMNFDDPHAERQYTLVVN